MKAVACAAILSTASFIAPALAQEEIAPAAEAAPPAPFLRVVDDPGRSLALEVAARRYLSADGEGPEVVLVGVAHIGDGKFYDELQTLLDEFDVVLYESVKPAGAASPGGDTEEEQIESTQAAMEFVASLLEQYRRDTGAYPAELSALVEHASKEDPRLREWIGQAMVDAWGGKIRYDVQEAPADFVLVSLGRDGARGGEGAAADLSIAARPGASPPVAEDGIQAQLAEALKLEFQLEAIDYGREHWRCSDMTMDQLERALAARGLEFGPLGGTLAGSSFPARLAGLLLKAIQILDVFVEGLVSDMAKVMMIEVLGDESITEQAMNQQFGGGFAEVIIGERNQVVVDDLERLVANEPAVETVAIFYGAAHMPDFERRLKEQLGYEAATGDRWLSVMRIDLRTSSLTETDLRQIRTMLRQSLRGAFSR